MRLLVDMKLSSLKNVGGASFGRGFTIVELLIVVVVIAILATITIVAYNGIQLRSLNATLDSELSQFSRYLETERVKAGDNAYPATAANFPPNSGSTLEYTNYATSNPNRYCLTATKNTLTKHIASDGSVTNGPCPGHAGTQVTNLSCPTGYITVPGNSYYQTKEFCVMKYEAKDVGGIATSQATSAPWVSISQPTAMTTSQAACSGCHLITESEWLTIAANVLSVPSNWSGGSVGSGYIYSGHNDNSPSTAQEAGTNDATGGYFNTGNVSPSNQRRTLQLTNGEYIWDFAGNVWEWTQGTISSNQPGLANESAFSSKEWNNPAIGWGSLAPNAKPGNAISNGGNWSSAQGIGLLYSNSSDATLRGFRRGGNWDSTTYSGVFGLLMGNSPTSTTGLVGFRVAK